MKPAEREADSATCGCKNTGSADVFINGKGATRTHADFAGGRICGAGAPTVLVNDTPLCLVGDAIASHGPSPHDRPTTSNPSPDVFASSHAAEEHRERALSFWYEDEILVASTQLVALGRGDDAADLIRRLNALRKKHGLAPMTKKQENAIRSLDRTRLRMLKATMNQLELLDAGQRTPAEYMFNVLKAAATISNEMYPNGSSSLPDRRGSLFIDLVNLSFSISGRHRGQILAGTPPQEAGLPFEDTYAKIVGANASGGFNRNVADSESPSSTITHHFGAFLKSGSSIGMLARAAHDHIDRWSENPGDVRNGYYAIDLGAWLNVGRISPSEAVRVTVWAYSANSGAPWPSKPLGYLDSIERMVDAYNKAHPGDHIGG